MVDLCKQAVQRVNVLLTQGRTVRKPHTQQRKQKKKPKEKAKN
jgi:hypothetical protein